MKLFENEPPISTGEEEINRLSGHELTLAMSEYQKAKKIAEENKTTLTAVRPNSPAYFKLQRELRDKELKQAEDEAIKKAEIAKSKEPVFIERPVHKTPEMSVVGKIEVKEPKDDKQKKIKKELISLFENPTIKKNIDSKLKPVYDHRPDPYKFVGLVDLQDENFYSQESIEKDLAYVSGIRSSIDDKNSLYGESLKSKRESGFEQSEIFQVMVIDLINKGWIPNMESIMTHDYDDLHAGIDSVMQYRKELYFGASFDMTINEDTEAIEKKIQKNWDHYISQGKVPYVKYFEDPENPENRGKRVMPKFIIGGSQEDLLSLTRAYINDDNELLQNHPLKYTFIAQIESQLSKILEFYNSPECALNSEFDYAREQYKHFEEFLADIKNSVDYDSNIQKDEVGEHIKNNKVYQISQSYTPKIKPKKLKEAA